MKGQGQGEETCGCVNWKFSVVDLRTLWASGEGNFLPATVFASAFRVAFFLVSSDEELSL